MTLLHYAVVGAQPRDLEAGGLARDVVAAFPLRRRYVHTGGDCQHCGNGYPMFNCPLCPARVCQVCAAMLPQRPLLAPAEPRPLSPEAGTLIYLNPDGSLGWRDRFGQVHRREI